MKILVTGGGGFLGSHLVKALVKQGHTVQTMSRELYPELDHLGIKQLRGDLQDPVAVIKACRGQEVVFHTASKVAMWGKWDNFYQTNTLGTKNLLKAAREQGVTRFIYTSTPSVVFSDRDLINAPNSTPYPELDSYKSLYAKSKALAEKEVLASHQNGEFMTVALRPHLIFGPGDKNIIPRLVQRAKSGRLRIVGDGQNQVDVIHVKNAVHAHLCALERLKTDSLIGGKSYFLGQEKPVILWNFINQILAHYKLEPVTKKISFTKAYRLGAVLEGLYRGLHIYKNEPPMTRFVSMQLAKSHYFDHHESETELGYKPIIELKDCFNDLDALA